MNGYIARLALTWAGRELILLTAVFIIIQCYRRDNRFAAGSTEAPSEYQLDCGDFDRRGAGNERRDCVEKSRAQAGTKAKGREKTQFTRGK